MFHGSAYTCAYVYESSFMCASIGFMYIYVLCVMCVCVYSMCMYACVYILCACMRVCIIYVHVCV